MSNFNRARRRKGADTPKAGEVAALLQSVTTVLEGWRAGLMATRRDMLAGAFDERIVRIEATDDLALPEGLHIEAMAILANYNEWRPTYLGEALAHMGWPIVHSIDAMQLRDEVRAWVDKIVDDKGRELADRLVEAQREEIARRSGMALAC